MNARPKVIAIDGPAAAGKGTLGKRRIAEHLGWRHPRYRADLSGRAQDHRIRARPGRRGRATAAARALRPGGSQAAGPARRRGGQRGRPRSTSCRCARPCSTFSGGSPRPPDGAPGAASLDGRDVGTVVCPDADGKLFVTASLEVRAARRVKELVERGAEAIHGRVLQDMKERDTRDSERDTAPLAPAENALLIDTSTLNPDEVFGLALRLVKAGRPSD